MSKWACFCISLLSIPFFLTAAVSLPLIENDTVYLTYESLTNTSLANTDVSSLRKQQLWFSVTYKKDRAKKPFLEFLVHDFAYEDSDNNYIDTRSGYCEGNQEEFFLLQKHFIKRPICVQIDALQARIVDHTPFIEFYDEVFSSTFGFASPFLYEGLAMDLLVLEEEALSKGARKSCPMGQNFIHKTEGMSNYIELLKDVGTISIGRVGLKTVKAAYNGEFFYREKTDPDDLEAGFWSIWSGKTKGTFDWSLQNRLQQTRHMEHEFFVDCQGMSLEVQVIEHLMPWKQAQ